MSRLCSPQTEVGQRCLANYPHQAVDLPPDPSTSTSPPAAHIIWTILKLRRKIIWHLSPKDLRHVARVNKTFNVDALPLVFENMSWEQWNDLLYYAPSIRSNSKFRESVKTLTINRPGERIDWLIDLLPRLLTDFPNLEEIDEAVKYHWRGWPSPTSFTVLINRIDGTNNSLSPSSSTTGTTPRIRIIVYKPISWEWAPGSEGFAKYYSNSTIERGIAWQNIDDTRPVPDNYEILYKFKFGFDEGKLREWPTSFNISNPSLLSRPWQQATFSTYRNILLNVPSESLSAVADWFDTCPQLDMWKRINDLTIICGKWTSDAVYRIAQRTPYVNKLWLSTLYLESDHIPQTPSEFAVDSTFATQMLATCRELTRLPLQQITIRVVPGDLAPVDITVRTAPSDLDSLIFVYIIPLDSWPEYVEVASHVLVSRHHSLGEKMARLLLPPDQLAIVMFNLGGFQCKYDVRISWWDNLCQFHGPKSFADYGLEEYYQSVMAKLEQIKVDMKAKVGQ